MTRSMTTSVFDHVRAVSSTSDSRSAQRGGPLPVEGSRHQRVGELNGGERLRASLAQGPLNDQGPELLLLDEPTNNLDLANVEFLKTLVSQFGGPLIVISHDERFLANCGIDVEFTLSGTSGMQCEARLLHERALLFLPLDHVAVEMQQTLEAVGAECFFSDRCALTAAAIDDDVFVFRASDLSDAIG
jgi:hypothetical protein